MSGYWFKSDLFQIDPGEDKETSPGRYGVQLARWLKRRFEMRGYPVEPIINEDWGRCLMCSREPFLLWVGCSNRDTGTGSQPSVDSIVWHCFPVVEVPFMKRISGKPDTSRAFAKFDTDLRTIIEAEPGITQVEEP